jgi:hypothetical protein
VSWQAPRAPQSHKIAPRTKSHTRLLAPPLGERGDARGTQRGGRLAVLARVEAYPAVNGTVERSLQDFEAYDYAILVCYQFATRPGQTPLTHDYSIELRPSRNPNEINLSPIPPHSPSPDQSAEEGITRMRSQVQDLHRPPCIPLYPTARRCVWPHFQSLQAPPDRCTRWLSVAPDGAACTGNLRAAHQSSGGTRSSSQAWTIDGHAT